MRFTPERCIVCGALSLGEIVPHDRLRADGHITNDMWVCSNDCYDRAIGAYSPPDYAYGKKAEDCEQAKSLVREHNSLPRDLRNDLNELFQESYNRALHNWRFNRDFVRDKAHDSLRNRCSDEEMALFERDMAKRRAEFEAESAKMEARVERRFAEALETSQKLIAQTEMQKERPIPERYRLEHTHILAGTGAGKTTLIQQFILDDLAKPDRPAIIVIDPKGTLVKRLSHLPADKVVIIDPLRAPALPLFVQPTRGDAATRRQIESQFISNFAYIFSTLDAKLSQKMSTPFTFCARLLFSMGNQNIMDFADLLDERPKSPQESRFYPHILKLDDIARKFFLNEFFAQQYADTRTQIKSRLYAILMRPELAEMFSARVPAFDLFELIQAGCMILVNTNMTILGSENSQLLGRYMIASVLDAAFQRITIPRSQWRRTYLYIDEAQEFYDDVKTSEMLRLAREFELGIVLAHQEMHGHGMTEMIRSAVATNTSIKYCASIGGLDLNYMARDMLCETQFITDRKKSATHAQFACSVRGFTDHPMIVNVPLGNITDEMMISEPQYQTRLRMNDLFLKPRPEPVAENLAPHVRHVEPGPEPDIGGVTRDPDVPHGDARPQIGTEDNSASDSDFGDAY